MFGNMSVWRGYRAAVTKVKINFIKSFANAFTIPRQMK